MNSVKGLARKRCREEEDASHFPEMPLNFQLPETPNNFHISEVPYNASKFREGKTKTTAAAEKGNDVWKAEESGERVAVDSPPASEIPPEIQIGWWDFPGDWPCYSLAVDEQLFCGWFPFVEEDFVGLYAQNEVIWEDDLWQLKDIHEIPNQSER